MVTLPFYSLSDHEIHRGITKRGFVQDTSEATDGGTDSMAFVLKQRFADRRENAHPPGRLG